MKPRGIKCTEKNWDIVNYSGAFHFESATAVALRAFCSEQAPDIELERAGGTGIHKVGGPYVGKGPLPGNAAPGAKLRAQQRPSMVWASFDQAPLRQQVKEGQVRVLICLPSCDSPAPTHCPQPLCLQPDGWLTLSPTLTFHPVLFSL